MLHSVLHNRIPCEHNNKLNAWASDNLAPLDMPFLSTIAKIYNKPNKSQYHTSTFVYYLPFAKLKFCFYLEKKTGPAKPEQPD